MFGFKKKFNVTEIFRSFQGEGPYTGENAIFIRLSKCNLTCNFCDTNHITQKTMSIDEIVNEVNTLASVTPKINFIVLTGGEPLLQPVEHLCEELLAHKYKIQIETNGTVFRKLDDKIKIVCSPKNVNGKFLINEQILARTDALKFILSKTFPDYQSVPDLGQQKYKIPIYVQPMDERCEEKNKNNLKYVIDICMKEKYKISLQMHKLVGAK